MEGIRIHITGVVQGVGFRPFVYNLAAKYGLKGYCLNDSEGVVIEVQGPSIDRFVEEIRTAPPPLSRIESVTVEPAENGEFSDFTIRESRPVEGKFALVSPDMAICGDCLRELFTPGDRRYLYPFINCTNCGPRYSIIRDIPYDRPKTTMAPFTMCPECDGEYHDPSDRRFHAQPNACAKCGPRVWLFGMERGEEKERDFEAIKAAQGLLKEGAVMAIKGLGGFHLACDATNENAVRTLRERKRRSKGKGQHWSNKPFAVMAPSVEAAREFAHISEEEEKALLDRKSPIVLLKKKSRNTLAQSVAPNNGRFGVMLPYTPLHHMLFHEAGFKALVMTSGNLSEEPIVISNKEAIGRLSGIADWFILHDRDIHMRVDDSIVRIDRGRERVLRRSRGFVPSVIELDEEMDGILACGAELKNTFCLTKGHNAILSQHIGDLENYESLEFYRETLTNLKNTFRAEPKIVAFDMHPDYLSTKFAAEYAGEFDVPYKNIVAVQHHHAHIVSCMAENGIKDKCMGVALDGTGYGTDGRVWGGEFLVADRKGFTRAAHLAYIPMPGGERAIKEPWRMALSYLIHTFGGENRFKPFHDRLDPTEAETVRKMATGGFNSPLTSSMGRLFDAISSLLAIRDHITFEAEAAIELETVARTEGMEAERPYPFALLKGDPAIIDVRPTIRSIIRDYGNSVPVPLIAGRFHYTVVEIISIAVKMLRDRTGINSVALSGGVFQNRTLSVLTEERLSKEGFIVYTHSRVPANDGGVSLGQAVVAWEAWKEREKGE